MRPRGGIRHPEACGQRGAVEREAPAIEGISEIRRRLNTGRDRCAAAERAAEEMAKASCFQHLDRSKCIARQFTKVDTTDAVSIAALVAFVINEGRKYHGER